MRSPGCVDSLASIKAASPQRISGLRYVHSLRIARLKTGINSNRPYVKDNTRCTPSRPSLRIVSRKLSQYRRERSSCHMLISFFNYFNIDLDYEVPFVPPKKSFKNRTLESSPSPLSLSLKTISSDRQERTVTVDRIRVLAPSIFGESVDFVGSPRNKFAGRRGLPICVPVYQCERRRSLAEASHARVPRVPTGLRNA